MSRMRTLMQRQSQDHAARVTRRALERAFYRAATPESRQELIVLAGTRS
ncbi:MAG: hypothetical protein QOE84_1409 [Actinomycetota bacterium]|jgi:hypothetical protein|nr:hypothetical protein [Actinomycetota bacterium]